MELDSKRMSQPMGYPESGDSGSKRPAPGMDLNEHPMKIIDELIDGRYTLSEDEINDLRGRFVQNTLSCVSDSIASALVDILRRLYDSDYRRLKLDISKQTLLKGTIELSSQERRHLMYFICQALPQYLDNCRSLIESLEKCCHGGTINGN